ncbi:MAG: hypothetical protein ACLUTA_17240 [Blautia wexlerae]
MTRFRQRFQGEATTGKLPFYSYVLKQVARDIAEYCGFSQAMTYSFESPKVFDKLRTCRMTPASVRQLQIRNPLGEDLQCYENDFLERYADFSGYEL